MAKIFIVIPNLKLGGVEKMRLVLAQSWIKSGHQVEVIVLKKIGELVELYENSTPSIPIHELSVDRIYSSFAPLSIFFKKHKPDIVLIGMWPLTVVGAIAWLIAGRPGRLFLSEHTQLSVSQINELNSSLFIMRLTIFFTYRLASGVIAVSEGVKRELVRLFMIPSNNIRVIYNPAGSLPKPESFLKTSFLNINKKKSKFLILAVGTLKDSKKYDLLIRAFANIPSCKKSTLYIIGDGPKRNELEMLIRELKLEDRIFLPGFTLNIAEWYSKASLFVLSSGWEGLGNVIIEALSFGVPIVSTNCPSGPSEILMNGQYGKLVPCDDVQALAVAIEASLWESHDTHSLIKRSQDFSTSTIAERYLNYFQLLK